MPFGDSPACSHLRSGQQEKRLTLARDRLGTSLVFRRGPGVFLFASELKPFFLHPALSARFPSKRSLRIFATAMCLLPFPFEGVHKLEPGGCCMWMQSTPVASNTGTRLPWRVLRSHRRQGRRRIRRCIRKPALTVVGEHLVADVPWVRFYRVGSLIARGCAGTASFTATG